VVSCCTYDRLHSNVVEEQLVCLGNLSETDAIDEMSWEGDSGRIKKKKNMQ